MNIEVGIDGSKSVYKKELDLTSNNNEVDIEQENYFLDNTTTKNIDLSQLENSDDLVKIEPKEDRALGVLWKKGTYTYTTSQGIKITLENINEDTQVFEDKQTGEIIVIGADNAIINGKNENSKISVYNSTISELEKGDNLNISVEDNNYQSLDINLDSISEIKSDVLIPVDENGNTISVDEYFKQVLNQEVGFETKEEYQQYVLSILANNLQSMKEMFEQQENSDGIISGGYNALKELTGLGVSDKDIEEILSKQTEVVEGLTKALNNEGDMTFEEAYEYYFGVEFSTEKIDSYLKLSNIYQASLVASNYDPDYMDKIEEKTGISLENIAQDYYLAQSSTMGEDTIYSELVEKYSADQENFSGKLSNTISLAGMGCIVAGAVISIIPGGAAVGLPLMAAGKYVSLGGMFVDNAMNLVDDATDKNGLTGDEVKDLAFETGVELASYGAGRIIGGFTGSLHNAVSSKAMQMGIGKVGSYILGQSAETAADTALSLAADYTIAQGQSLITTGELMDGEDYWSIDRFLSEGKNQLIGILTGLASEKVNKYSNELNLETKQKTLPENGADEIETLKNAEGEFTSEDFKMYEQNPGQVKTDEVQAGNDARNRQKANIAGEENKLNNVLLSSAADGNSFILKTDNAEYKQTAISADSEAIPTIDLLKEAIKGTEAEAHLYSYEIKDLSKAVDYAYNRLSKSGLQITREDIVQIAEKTEFSSNAITDLVGMKNEFGNAYVLSKLLEFGLVDYETMDKVSGGISRGGSFNLTYRDNFDKVLKLTNSDNQVKAYQKIATEITRGNLSTQTAELLLKNVPALSIDDIDFIQENIGSSKYYSPEEYLEAFLYFKNLTTNDGVGILNMGELEQKAQFYGMGDSAADVKTNKTLYNNLNAMLNIDPSSVEASYMTTFIELIQNGDVNASALRSLRNVSELKNVMYVLMDEADIYPVSSHDDWSFSLNLKNDIDKMYDVISKNTDSSVLQAELMNAFIPEVGSDIDGIKQVNIGDVYKIQGEDGIRIKISNTESQYLNISKETYYNLFPPVERFASAQQVLGDCYCIENLMLLYSIPDQRVHLLEMFSEDLEGNITIKMPNSDFKVVFENGKFPQNQNPDMYSSGAEAFKLLEYAYGKVLIDRQINEAVQNLSGVKLAEFCEFLEENPNNTYVYKDDDGEFNYMRYDEAIKHPEIIQKCFNNDTFSTIYATYNATLLGNGGMQYNVMKALGFDSTVYVPFLKMQTDEEIDILIDEVRNNQNLSSDAKQMTIETLTAMKNLTDDEKQDLAMQCDLQNDEAIKTYENIGVERNNIQFISDSIKEDIKDPNFYKDNIVQLGMGAHAYGLTCEQDSNGDYSFYLYNPHNQGIPIKITNMDALFNKQGLIQIITITKRK